MAEELVEVPTVLSYALLQLQTAERISDIPVPRRRRGQGGLQGSHPGQMQRAVDNPASGGPQLYDLGASSSSAVPRDERGQGVFALFPREKVRRSPGPRGPNWVRTLLHGRQLLVWTRTPMMTRTRCLCVMGSRSVGRGRCLGCRISLASGFCVAACHRGTRKIQGDGFPGDRHGVRLLLLVLRDGRGAGECIFLDYPLTQRPRSSRRVRPRRDSLRRPWEEFDVLGVCTRCLHKEIWCIIPLRLCIWQSIPRYLGVACGARNIGFFRR